MIDLLLIEDTETLLHYYSRVLERAGVRVRTALNGAEGLDQFMRHRPAVVALDLSLPDREGLTLMRDCLAVDPSVRFVVITAFGSIKMAVEAMRQGAFDFLAKPFGDAELVAAVQRASARRSSVASRPLGPPPAPRSAPRPAVESSRECAGQGHVIHAPVMQDLYRRCRAVAQSDVPVFLVGPEGSGRLSAAREIHAHSSRAGAPFLVLRAQAMDEAAQLAALARAAPGTLFLSEPAALSARAQRALLGHLQAQEDHQTQPPINSAPTLAPAQMAHLICASQDDPSGAVAQGRLREDLFHRLYVAPIAVPPLCARGEDVIAIATQTLRRIGAETGTEVKGLSPEVAAVFRRYSWPGNVRQLITLVRCCAAQYAGPLLTLEMLPPEMHARAAAPDADLVGRLDALIGLGLAQMEQLFIEATVENEGGSVPRAARTLGVSPSTLYRKRESWAKAAAPGG